jgi:protein tyrosine phosphatase
MVWQQDIRVIVMLTAETESGQIKAHNYWNDKHFGPLRLTFLSENRASLEPAKIHRHKSRPSVGHRKSTNPHLVRHASSKEETEDPKEEQPFVIVRRFTLSNGHEPFERMREITQLQYSNWPDFGAPAHPAHLLGLVEQCDAVVRAARARSPSAPAAENSRPILVHCSAGCGRTGTFCTVDSVIDMLKRQRAHVGPNGEHAKLETAMPVGSQFPSVGDAMDGVKRSLSGSDSGIGDAAEGSLCSPLAGHGENSWLDREDFDLVEKTVADFRLQRLSMVQSLRQFVLCYESVLEWLAMEQNTTKSA